MRGNHVLQPRAVQISDQPGRLGIVQVSKPTGDALLERQRIVAARQQIRVMIGFQHQRIATVENAPDVGSRAAGIRQHA